MPRRGPPNELHMACYIKEALVLSCPMLSSGKDIDQGDPQGVTPLMLISAWLLPCCQDPTGEGSQRFNIG